MLQTFFSLYRHLTKPAFSLITPCVFSYLFSNFLCEKKGIGIPQLPPCPALITSSSESVFQWSPVWMDSMLVISGPPADGISPGLGERMYSPQHINAEGYGWMSVPAVGGKTSPERHSDCCTSHLSLLFFSQRETLPPPTFPAHPLSTSLSMQLWNHSV